VSAELLRRAAAEMRQRAEAATDGGFGWRLADLPGANEVWADRDAAGHDAFMVATTATRLNPNPGIKGHADATHIASWHPTVALAVADWLEDAAENLDLQAPGGDLAKQWDMRVHIAGDKALAVAHAYLGDQP
jgi:hypothetical protein